ncbi:YitT family protein [uncultured Dysosmobacter sp.]|uniref:YczE/YyaS/YitT family protein n=1 Tax=uncultured Dysosmobacter sp. TaxID=2591384 RepID=UPI002605C9E0|nr:YitT family protein [uncultured Dysosmobacter sp.]
MNREYPRRLLVLLGGLAVSAVGITMMLQANIGLEPWSVLQQGMSKSFGITYGTAAMIVGAVVVAAAFLCGESFGLGTLANIFVCPLFIDLLLYLDWIPLMESLPAGLVMLLAGMELLALGTWLYMKSGLGSGPRDALMVVLARKTRRSVGFCRSSVEILAIAVGFLLGGQVGVGTVITGVGIGPLFNLNFALLHFRAAEVRQENVAETFRNLCVRQ